MARTSCRPTSPRPRITETGSHSPGSPLCGGQFVEANNSEPVCYGSDIPQKSLHSAAMVAGIWKQLQANGGRNCSTEPLVFVGYCCGHAESPICGYCVKNPYAYFSRSFASQIQKMARRGGPFGFACWCADQSSPSSPRRRSTGAVVEATVRPFTTHSTKTSSAQAGTSARMV